MAVFYASRRLQERPLVSVSHAVVGVVADERGEVDTGQVAALAAVFGQVTDPRKARGVRHRLSAVLTVLTVALLCGARNFRQAADRVAELPQVLLAAAGARRHPVLGIRIAPGRDTLRRLVEAVDAAMMDRLVCAWLACVPQQLTDPATRKRPLTSTDRASHRRSGVSLGVRVLAGQNG
ncbi:transposase family protein [Micromonospora tulbaghiae]|uniref:transposase family protein n=1 Tax=Micromonospora tulbaghiae TaxID=479978 RepID=UPI00368AFE14